MDNKLLNDLCALFNWDIDWELLFFIFNEYDEFKYNPNINVENYPFVKELIDKQEQLNNNMKMLCDTVQLEGIASKEKLITSKGNEYVVKITLKKA